MVRAKILRFAGAEPGFESSRSARHQQELPPAELIKSPNRDLQPQKFTDLGCGVNLGQRAIATVVHIGALPLGSSTISRVDQSLHA